MSDQSQEHQQLYPSVLGRVDPEEYFEEYVPPRSEAFQQRVKELFSLVEAYKKHWNKSRWARCCFTFEKRALQGCLGHPEEKMIDIRKLISRERIQTHEDLQNYLTRVLPKNRDGDILLPQMNMKHRTIKEEDDDGTNLTSQVKSEAISEQTDPSQALLDRQLDELGLKKIK